MRLGVMEYKYIFTDFCQPINLTRIDLQESSGNSKCRGGVVKDLIN